MLESSTEKVEIPIHSAGIVVELEHTTEKADEDLINRFIFNFFKNSTNKCGEGQKYDTRIKKCQTISQFK